jgi:hypothetical protein
MLINNYRRRNLSEELALVEIDFADPQLDLCTARAARGRLRRDREDCWIFFRNCTTHRQTEGRDRAIFVEFQLLYRAIRMP